MNNNNNYIENQTSKIKLAYEKAIKRTATIEEENAIFYSLLGIFERQGIKKVEEIVKKSIIRWGNYIPPCKKIGYAGI